MQVALLSCSLAALDALPGSRTRGKLQQLVSTKEAERRKIS